MRPEFRGGAGVPIAGARQTRGQSEKKTAPQADRCGLDHSPSKLREPVHRPVRGILACACHDALVVSLLSKKAQDREQRSEAYRSSAEAATAQPVLVEIEAKRQGIGNPLMEARHENPADWRFSHGSPRTYNRSMPSAAILTGGLARRFGGCDKSALAVDGRPILDWQISALRPLTDDILLVGEGVTSNSRARARDRAVRFVDDRVIGRGPLGGLDAALAAARDDILVLVACDMPFVTAAFLTRLADLAKSADAAVPLTERGYHPLCAAYARTCQAAVATRLAEGRLALVGLLEEVRVRAVTRQELHEFGGGDRLLANINTPHEYANLVGRDRHYIA